MHKHKWPRPRRVLLLMLATASWASRPASGQAAAPFVEPADLFQIRAITDVALSPDGQQVAFTVTGLPADGSLERFASHVRVASANKSEGRIVTPLEHSARSPKWSPDGRWLAYLSDESGRNDVWIGPSVAGSAQRLTRTPTAVQSFAWAPHGNAIALTMADPPDPAVAERQKLVRLASDPIPPTRLWIVAVDSPGQLEALTPASMNVLGVPEWSPDGSSIAFNHAPSTGQEAASQAMVSVVTIQTKRMKELRHVGQFPATLSFSHDGAWVVLRASTRPSPGFGSAAVYAIKVDDRQTKVLGPADHLTEVAGWSPATPAVLVVSQVGTFRHVIRYALQSTASDTLYSGPLVVSSLSLSADRRTGAFVGESLDTPPEVYVTAVSPFKPRALTAINSNVSLAPFGRTELITWKSRDGKTIEGLLTYPVRHGGSRTAPLLVVAHSGGETFSSSYVASPFNPGSRGVGSRGAYPPAVFSSRGYAVLRANHRGGVLGGYGFDASLPAAKPEERANSDILGGVDLTVSMGVADPERLAIMGHSNGGLVTASLITNSDRFAAASLLAGFPFLEVQAGTGSWIPLDLGAEPWEDPQPYVDHSPSFALHRVKSPTLVQHGEDDRGIPVAQARALHGSLTKLGVPTELAIYPGMGHSPSTPRQVLDIVERNVAWFNRHVMKH